MARRSRFGALISIAVALSMLALPVASAATGPPMPTARGAAGAAVAGGVIHVVGGSDSYGGSLRHQVNEAYSISSGTWSTKAPPPDTNMWDPETVAVGASIYTIGGYPSGQLLTRRYDPGTNTWSTLAPVPSPGFNWGHAAVAVGNSIYVMGGTAGAVLKRYDVATDSWSSLTGPTYTGNMAAVSDGSKLYVINESGDLQIYDIASDTWTLGPDSLNTFYGPSAALAGGVMFVFGQTSVTGEIALGYHLATGEWKRYHAEGAVSGWPVAVNASDGIHVFGGFHPIGGGPSNQHLVFDPATAPIADGCDPSTSTCGTSNDDNMSGTSGADVMYGGDGNDSISSGDGNDDVSGDAGNDVIDTGSGDDTASGGAGSDEVRGRDGNDSLSGGGGTDTLDGGGGADTAAGGEGADTLAGGGGNDVLDGGRRLDRINGGRGRDKCFFDSRREKRRMRSCEVKRFKRFR